MPDSNKDSPEEYAKKVSDMATDRRRDPFPHPAREKPAVSYFAPGQKVFEGPNDYTVVLQDENEVWVRSRYGMSRIFPAIMLSANNPNLPAEPQNCPLCGNKAAIEEWAVGWATCYCSGPPESRRTKCLRGPDIQGRENAIAAWNSIRVVKEEKVKP